MKLNRVYLDDVFDFLNCLPDDSIDLAIIDPPYNQNIARWDSFSTENEYFEFTYKWIDKVIPKLRDSASLYLFNNAYNSAFILTYLINKKLIFKNWITWYKKDGFSPSRRKYVNNQEIILFLTKTEKYVFNFDDIRVPYLSKDRMKSAEKKGILKNGKRWFPNKNGRLCPDVWEFSSTRHTNKVHGKIVKSNHPTPKPAGMIERMILASSNENDVVLDLFSGSGITSLVSKKHNRQFIGCDNDEEYVKTINRKLVLFNAVENYDV